MFHQANDCINCGYEIYHHHSSGYCYHGGTGEDATGYEPIGLWRLIKGWFRRSPKLDLDFDAFTEL